MEISRKQKWEEKQLHGRFKRLTSDISRKKTSSWLKKMLGRIESLLIEVQNNLMMTNHIKARIDKTQYNSRCGLRGDKDEITL